MTGTGVATDNISRSHEPTHRLVRRPVGAPAERQSIFDEAPAADPGGHATPANRKPTLDERFAIFLVEEPEVVDEFVRLVRLAKASGRERAGGKSIAEVIRWERYLATGAGFKINNSLISRLVRHVQELHPDLAEMFETRELKS